MEAKAWAPSRWSPVKIQRTVRHAYGCALVDLYLVLGPHDGAIAAAQLRCELASEQSRVQLAALGIRTLGDLLDLPNDPMERAQVIANITRKPVTVITEKIIDGPRRVTSSET